MTSMSPKVQKNCMLTLANVVKLVAISERTDNDRQRVTGDVFNIQI